MNRIFRGIFLIAFSLDLVDIIICSGLTTSLNSENNYLNTLKSKITNFDVIFNNYKETTSLYDLYLLLKDTSNKYLGPTFSENDPIVKFQLKVIEKFYALGSIEENLLIQFEEIKEKETSDVRFVIVYVCIMEKVSHEDIISIFKSILFIKKSWIEESVGYFEKKVVSQLEKDSTSTNASSLIGIIEKLSKHLGTNEKLQSKINTWKIELEKKNIEEVKPEEASLSVNAETLQQPNIVTNEVSKVKNFRRKKRPTTSSSKHEYGYFTTMVLFTIGFVLSMINNVYRLVRNN